MGLCKARWGGAVVLRGETAVMAARRARERVALRGRASRQCAVLVFLLSPGSARGGGQHECRQQAEAAGLEVGGAGRPFASMSSARGCYTFASGPFCRHAYFSLNSTGVLQGDQVLVVDAPAWCSLAPRSLGADIEWTGSFDDEEPVPDCVPSPFSWYVEYENYDGTWSHSRNWSCPTDCGTAAHVHERKVRCVNMEGVQLLPHECEGALTCELSPDGELRAVSQVRPASWMQCPATAACPPLLPGLQDTLDQVYAWVEDPRFEVGLVSVFSVFVIGIACCSNGWRCRCCCCLNSTHKQYQRSDDREDESGEWLDGDGELSDELSGLVGVQPYEEWGRSQIPDQRIYRGST